MFYIIVHCTVLLYYLHYFIHFPAEVKISDILGFGIIKIITSTKKKGVAATCTVFLFRNKFNIFIDKPCNYAMADGVAQGQQL